MGGSCQNCNESRMKDGKCIDHLSDYSLDRRTLHLEIYLKVQCNTRVVSHITAVLVSGDAEQWKVPMFNVQIFCNEWSSVRWCCSESFSLLIWLIWNIKTTSYFTVRTT